MMWAAARKPRLVALLVFVLTAGLLSEWHRNLLRIRPPDTPEAVQWLQLFYEEQARSRSPGGFLPPSGSALECGAPAQPTKTNLVVGVVGDKWQPSTWLSRPEHATFDLAVVYYGSNASFACGACTHVLRVRGPKWYLYHNLTESPKWGEMLGRGYEYIMLPDDDLQLDTCQINTFFSVLKEFDVLLAQPSVCRGEGSYTCWDEMYQDPRYRLRFTNFVEIMAPAFRMDFFQAVVRPTLRGTYTGYGLDFIWPGMLRWPRDKVAVVDEVCMVHPPSPPGGKTGGLYDITTMFTEETGYEEQRRTNRKYNYWQPVVWLNGMLWKTPKVFWGVPTDEAARTLQERGLEASREPGLLGRLWGGLLAVARGGFLLMLLLAVAVSARTGWWLYRLLRSSAFGRRELLPGSHHQYQLGRRRSACGLKP